MSQVESLSYSARQVVRRLSDYRAVWLLSAAGCGVLALMFSLVNSRPWEASQAVVVRQEATASTEHPGKFADLYAMRTLQETILELAKSRHVIAATLKAVESTANGTLANDPSASEIDDFRDQFTMLPPGGAEFGKTEVFYLRVKDPNRARALNLVAEMARQLDSRLQELRNEQAQGLVEELKQQVRLAEQLNEEETKRLAQYEAAVGSDLGELRMLHSSFSGQSDLRQQYVNLETQARGFQTQMRDSKELLELLRSAQSDPSQIVATPNSLLVSQPALRRLKDGLVDAQLVTAKLQGTRSAQHPRVVAAQEAEEGIRRDLFQELQSAIETAEAELELNTSRHTAARNQLTELESRLATLAEKRAEYSNRVAALETSRQTLDRVKQQLNTAQASRSASEKARVLTPLDEPETGASREGIGMATMSLAGLLGGLSLGVGLVLLTGGPSVVAPQAASPERTQQPPVNQEAPKSEWWESAEIVGRETTEALPAEHLEAQRKAAESEAAEHAAREQEEREIAERAARIAELNAREGVVINSAKPAEVAVVALDKAPEEEAVTEDEGSPENSKQDLVAEQDHPVSDEKATMPEEVTQPIQATQILDPPVEEVSETQVVEGEGSWSPLVVETPSESPQAESPETREEVSEDPNPWASYVLSGRESGDAKEELTPDADYSPRPETLTVSTTEKTLMLNPGVLPSARGTLEEAEQEFAGMSLEEAMNAAVEAR